MARRLRERAQLVGAQRVPDLAARPRRLALGAVVDLLREERLRRRGADRQPLVIDPEVQVAPHRLRRDVADASSTDARRVRCARRGSSSPPAPGS